MRKFFFVSMLAVMAVALLAGTALAKVAIVKGDNIDLMLKTYKMNTDRTFMQGRTVGRKMDVIAAEWTKESEEYIGKLTREAIELAGDFPVKRGDVVVIKPNAVISFTDFWKMWTYAPALSKDPVKMQAQVTDPRIVREIAIMAHEAGARRIIIGEASNAGHALAGLQGYGYNHMVEDLGSQGIHVELLDFDDPVSSPSVWVKTKGLANDEYAIPRIIAEEADVLINVPNPKSHTVAGITASLKLVTVGLMPAPVYGTFKLAAPHLKFSEWSTDINTIRKKGGKGTILVDYTVQDALVIGEAEQGAVGPDTFPVPMGLIVAGPGALEPDVVITAIMGFNPQNYGQFRMAEDHGLGSADLTKIEIVGRKISEVREKVNAPFHAWRWPAEGAGILAWDNAYDPPAYRGPEKARVSIVKAGNMDLALNTIGLNTARTFMQGKWRGRKADIIRAEWTKESEAYIGKLTREAIELAGNWPVKKGHVVYIKPNLVNSWVDMFEGQSVTSPEQQAHVTDVRIVREIVKMAWESGAKKIIIGEGTRSGADSASLSHWGYYHIADELKGQGINVVIQPIGESPYTWVKTKGLSNKEYAIPTAVAKEADVLISVPQMKCHTIAGSSLSLKNVTIGLPTHKVYGTFKLALPHMNFVELTMDMNLIHKKSGKGTQLIDYTVVDALWAGEGDQGGAWGGPGSFPVAMGLIIAGSDALATDVVTTAVMGFNPMNYGQYREAPKYGLKGTNDLTKIKVVGKSIKEVQEKLVAPMHSWRWPDESMRNIAWDEIWPLPAGVE
ncbi:MAG: DUF362 domain-containing protein [Desulfatiglandaceae bacterium]